MGAGSDERLGRVMVVCEMGWMPCMLGLRIDAYDEPYEFHADEDDLTGGGMWR